MIRHAARPAARASARPAILDALLSAQRSARPAALLVSLVPALLVIMVALPTHSALALGLAAPSIDPSAVTEIRIHKFEQPPTRGTAATGLPQDTTGLVPVAGATFTARLVPGIDLTTSAGQAAAAALTAADAAALVAGRPIAATDETDGAGDATLAPLGVGLYYVQETVTPSGYVGAAPFLVALPLTNPETLNDRLTVVHVYPKNAHVSISLDVRDADAVAVGDTVSWTSRSSIPNLPVLDGYRIVQEIDPKLELVGAAGGAPGDAAGEVVVALDCAGCPPLQTGVHYTRSYDPVTREITVDFTAAGLRVLEDAVSAHPDASVTVGYGTRVLGDGELRNRALLYADRASIDGDPGSAGPVSDTAVTKWGPLAILVHERGKPNVLIPGAKFRLFLSAEDAKAGRNPIVVDGTSEWTTDENGEIRVDGLRFSDFVDGLERDESDPLYRSYYVILTEIPEGYRGTKTPIALSVTSTVEPQIAVVELWRPQVGGDDDDDDGDQDGGLSTTGVRIAGIGLLGAILAIGGAMILARRRERDEDRAVQ